MFKDKYKVMQSKSLTHFQMLDEIQESRDKLVIHANTHQQTDLMLLQYDILERCLTYLACHLYSPYMDQCIAGKK